MSMNSMSELERMRAKGEDREWRQMEVPTEGLAEMVDQVAADWGTGTDEFDLVEPLPRRQYATEVVREHRYMLGNIERVRHYRMITSVPNPRS